MNNNASVKASVERQFSQVADRYRTSTVHAAGEDLAQMLVAAQLQGHEAVLDAGSGAGHTALTFAPHVASVVSVDLSAAMLAQGRQQTQARGITNIDFRLADVEDLPFPDQSFDLVVSRYSAHHWPRPQRALAHFRRLLRPGGCVLLSDIVSRPDYTYDTHLQAFELLRDPSHVRDHTPAAWLVMLAEAGFAGEVVFAWSLRLDFTNWVERMATPPATIGTLRTLMDGAPEEIRAAFAIEEDHSFAIPGALIKAQPKVQAFA